MQEQFLKYPLLPEKKVSCVIMSDIRPQLLQRLNELDIRTLSPARLSGIDGSESHHADMALCSVGNGRFFAASQLDRQTALLLEAEGAELEYTEAPVSAKAPCLNVCILRNSVILDKRTADPKLIRYLSECGYKLIHTNQRYAKCSAAVVSGDAVITGDPSIFNSCKENGIDVLKISPGFIELEGYEYGFIGGCCGLLSPDVLAFTGDISLHPDYESIRAFSKNHGVDLFSLTDEILYDVGGILPYKYLAK